MSDYNQIKSNDKVESVRFVGGGIAMVMLKQGYTSPKATSENGRERCCPFFRHAVEFVDTAVQG